jgi:hypothetical protein
MPCGEGAQGGLPGLILRLRSDGHEQLRLVGPPGLLPLLLSYQHLFKWRHPQLLLDPWGPSGCRAGIQFEVLLPSVKPFCEMVCALIWVWIPCWKCVL